MDFYQHFILAEILAFVTGLIGYEIGKYGVAKLQSELTALVTKTSTPTTPVTTTAPAA